MDPLIGTIIIFAGNFAPRGWAFCDGSLLAISANQALFAIIGTTYGGNGTTTFALPDLRGRVPMGVGSGPGLPVTVLGQVTGSPTTTLTVSNMPTHTHTASLIAEGAPGNTANPTNALLSISVTGDQIYGPDTVATEVNMNPKAVQVQPAGNGTPFDNMQPSLGINYIIATEGVFPSRP